MLNSNVYYHGIIRKCIVGFGSLFSDIYIDRREGDSVTGTVSSTITSSSCLCPKRKMDCSFRTRSRFGKMFTLLFQECLLRLLDITTILKEK
jgi:hypothetical protein